MAEQSVWLSHSSTHGPAYLAHLLHFCREHRTHDLHKHSEPDAPAFCTDDILAPSWHCVATFSFVLLCLIILQLFAGAATSRGGARISERDFSPGGRSAHVVCSREMRAGDPVDRDIFFLWGGRGRDVRSAPLHGHRFRGPYLLRGPIRLLMSRMALRVRWRLLVP